MTIKVIADFFGENILLGFPEAKSVFSQNGHADNNRPVESDDRKTEYRSGSQSRIETVTLVALPDIRSRIGGAPLVRFCRWTQRNRFLLRRLRVLARCARFSPASNFNDRRARPFRIA